VAAAFGLSGTLAGGVLLACLALGSWASPVGSSLLEFSQADMAFLFPSPMSRRQLVIYRLLRSQSSVLIGALIMALAYPTGSVVSRVRGLAALWLLLMTSHVFFTGVTLARARTHGTARRRWPGWLGLVWPAAAVLSLLLPLLAGASRVRLDTASAAFDAVMAVAVGSPARWLLLPFTALVHPLFAESLAEYGWALAGAVLVYAASVGWLLWVDALAPEVANAALEQQAVAARPAPGRSYKARPVPWRLGASGRPEVVFLWKGVRQSFRTVDRRLFLRAVGLLAWVVFASLLVSRSRGLVALLSVGATWAALFAVFMGPQMQRADLRQDLAHLELLKTWPVGGASLVRGQMLWPALSVTLATWALALLAVALSLVSLPFPPGSNRVVVWAGFLLLAPGVILAEYLMHNAVAVFFPGWVPLGPSRPRGVDAVGQRLLLLAANWLGLSALLLPGALVTGALWALLPSLRPWVVLPGALLTSLLVLVEVVLASKPLGRLFDRLDLTSVERSE